MDWFNVKDRFPELHWELGDSEIHGYLISDDVLVLTDRGMDIAVLEIDYLDSPAVWCLRSLSNNSIVTHWMPLPKFPGVPDES